MTHKYGETVLPAEPHRAVVDFTQQDILLALGVTPVATTEWHGEQPFAVCPRATSTLGDAEPEVIKAPDQLPLEQIAALTPDLIHRHERRLTKDFYASLTKIAPTIANSGKYSRNLMVVTETANRPVRYWRA